MEKAAVRCKLVTVKIGSLTLQNFRCFGPDAVTIDLLDSTAFVGANGAGKSAVLEALVRLFGASASDRRLVRSDFHLPADQAADEVDEASLLIEARLDFPELEEEADGDAVPECFNQMTVAGEDGALYCRVRLEATWRRTSSPEGEIEEPVYMSRVAAAGAVSR